MYGGTNIARPNTPIDLETVQRNLREVMTNLQLLENGENVRVEDLIRQARENLNQNRIFILRNLGEHGINNNLENNLNENRILTVQLERLNPLDQRVQQLMTGEQLPPVQNVAVNAEYHVNHNQEGNIGPNNEDNDGVRRMEIQVRQWAELYERDWATVRQNDNENVQPNNAANIGINENPELVPNDLRINPRPNRDNNRLHVRRGCPHHNVVNANRPDQGADQANAAPRRAANMGCGAVPLVINREQYNHLLESGVNNLAIRRLNNVANMVLGGPAPVRWEPYQRPAAPQRDADGLEERIAMLQDRLDRLEDGRFYDIMIVGRGEDRIRNMIRSIRQRLQRDNVANGHVHHHHHHHHANRHQAHRCNAPHAAANQEPARRPANLPPPPPPRRHVCQLAERAQNLAAPNQNQQGTAAKRPLTGENSERTNRHQCSSAKRPNIEGNHPGRSTDTTSPPRNHVNVVADRCNIHRNVSAVPQINLHNGEETNHLEVSQNVRNLPENLSDDQRPGPSRGRNEPVIGQNNIDRVERDEPDNFEEEDRNNPQNEENPDDVEENSENVEQNQDDDDDDVIIVSGNVPLHIKVERESDDDDDNENNVDRNHQDQDLRRENLMPPPPAPVLRLPREDRGVAARAFHPRIVNYAREILRSNSRAKGPEFPGNLERPVLTLEIMTAGLQNLVSEEARQFGVGNRKLANLQDNQWDAIQLELLKTYVKLKKEIREVILNTDRLGIQGHTVSSSRTSVVFIFNLAGPLGSPYEGGEIGVKIRVGIYEHLVFDKEVSLTNRIWHPNICPFTGRILHQYPWANMTLFKMLALVRRLLIIPELENARTHNAVARQVRSNPDIFRRTAQHWMSVYGSHENLAIPEYAELLERLVEEGIPKDRALHLLSKNNWDIDRAMEEIS